jgi:hypothetical protein
LSEASDLVAVLAAVFVAVFLAMMAPGAFQWEDTGEL